MYAENAVFLAAVRLTFHRRTRLLLHWIVNVTRDCFRPDSNIDTFSEVVLNCHHILAEMCILSYVMTIGSTDFSQKTYTVTAFSLLLHHKTITVFHFPRLLVRCGISILEHTITVWELHQARKYRALETGNRMQYASAHELH